MNFNKAPPTKEELQELNKKLNYKKPPPTEEERKLLGASTSQLEPTKTESFVRGLAQGGSLGFADELTGALGAVSDVAGDKYQLADLLERYKAQRDESREAYKKAEEANPLTSIAGNIAGGAATALIPGLGQANLANAIKIGAATGLGASEGDTLGEQVKSAGLGAGLGTAAYGAGKTLGALSDLFKTSEIGRSFRSSLGVGEKYGVNAATTEGLEKAQQILKNKTTEIFNPIDKITATNAAAKRKIVDEASANIARSKDDFIKEAQEAIASIYQPASVKSGDVEYKELADLVNSIGSPEVPAIIGGKLTTVAGDIKANARMYDDIRKIAGDIMERKDVLDSRSTKAASKIYDLAKQYTRDSVDELSKVRLAKIDETLSASKNLDKIMSFADGNKVGDVVKDQGKVASLIDKLESISSSGLTAQLKKDAAVKEIAKMDPRLAQRFNAELEDTAALMSVVKGAQMKSINLDIINKSAPTKLGTAIGSNKMYQDVKKLATKSSEYYNQVADRLLSKEGNQAMANVFKKMANADNNTRNALLFGLYQNPSYRQMMDQLASSEE